MSEEISSENITDNIFYIGICMAGAVSAGAYSAGVMDYLLEALETWETKKDIAGVPKHAVQIPVIGGASAGGMTAIITAAALNNPLTHIDKPSLDPLMEHLENKLYHSWVDLTGVDMLSQMLKTTDLERSPCKSALNSDFIEKIADRIMKVDDNLWHPLPVFISTSLKLFTTISNLEGFDYVMNFTSTRPELSKYHMVIHNDYACFQLTEDYIPGTNNGWIPLNMKNNRNTLLARDAAMATGAFPIGLKSRMLHRDGGYVNNNKWLNAYLDNNQLPNGVYTSLNVDGGMINNEPFEKVQDVLTDITGQTSKEYNNFNLFRSTVLMIEPFPTTKSKPISKQQDLFHIAGLTLSAMIAQSRSKPVSVANALNPDCAGQYLISPSRKVTGEDGDEELTGERAIACGALGGFSGFISKEFRVHDYFLGRHNCKIFLRDYFTVPVTTLEQNAIFRDGYAGVDKSKFKSRKDNTYQIIPVFDDVTNFAFPNTLFRSGNNWPSIRKMDINAYYKPVKKRVQAILMNTVDMGPVTKFLLWIGAIVLLNRKIAGAVLDKIKSDLTAWRLMDN